MFRLTRFGVLVCAAGIASAAPDTAVSQAKTAMAHLPLRFEANPGHAAPDVRYIARASGYAIELHPGGVTLRPAASKPLTISLLDSNPQASIEATDPLPLRVNYFIGHRENWRTNVASYAKVQYSNVYPGIDVVFYGNQNQLEYDLVLRPDADPRAIRLKISGDKGLRISGEGDLIVESAAGRMIQKKPVIYQEDSRTGARREIAGRYILLSRHVAALRLSNYDRSRALVIDPAISYLTYLGGTGVDQINAVKLANNKLYVVGQTDSDQLVASGTGYNYNNTGLIDCFIAIFDTNRPGFDMEYLSYLGGSNNDIPLALDVDPNGVIYITGTTTSTDFPVSSQAFQSTGAAASVDAFVVALDPSQGNGAGLLFSSYLGGSANDSGNGIAVDSKGLIYVIGSTQSSDFSVTATAYQVVLWGAQDTFLTQIDPNAGVILYSTYLGGESDDYGRAILVGKDGLVYFAASTLSQYFPMAGQNFNPNANNGSGTGALDIIIGVMDMTQNGASSLVYSTFFGGSGNDDVRAMAFDQSGNLLITGYTLNACDGCPGDFPVTSNALQSTYAGNGDAFVSVVNPKLLSGAFLIYSTYLGGAHGEVGYGVGSDSAGNLYVAGYTLSSDFPVVNAAQQTWGGGTNLFVTRFKPGAAGKSSISYSTYVGATGIYVPTGLAVGPDGTTYVAGWGNTGLNPTNNAAQGAFAGGVSDGFVLAIAQ